MIRLQGVLPFSHPPTSRRTRSPYLPLLLFLVTCCLVYLGWPRRANQEWSSLTFRLPEPFPDLERPNLRFNATHLILVVCHAIYLGGDPLLQKSWWLEPYQRNDETVHGIVEHIVQGVQTAREIHATGQNAVLLFAGTQTRPLAGIQSEGQFPF